MRTQLAVFHTYSNGEFRKEYGVKVMVDGKWAFLGDSKTVYRSQSLEDAQAKRASIRNEKPCWAAGHEYERVPDPMLRGEWQYVCKHCYKERP